MKKKNEPVISFKVLSFLLSYPESYWINEIPVLLGSIKDENLVQPKELANLISFAEPLIHRDLIDLQAEYVACFDQNRSLSLHLFEHIHGESRDRGQAMVDLSEVYQQHGLMIEAKELPDYLPLFLECMSVISQDDAIGLLQECLHIIEALTNTLANRGHPYTAVFNAILSLANRPSIPWTLQDQLYDDPTAAERLDREWEEEEIKFLGNSCSKGASSGGEKTTHRVDVSAITKKTSSLKTESHDE